MKPWRRRRRGAELEASSEVNPGSENLTSDGSKTPAKKKRATKKRASSTKKRASSRKKKPAKKRAAKKR